MRTKKTYGSLLTVWSITFLLAFSFIMVHRLPAQADEATEHQMRELFNKAGPPPEAIINPPKPVTYTLSAQERLRRFWREKILGFRITYASARGKACHANQRVIAGAVEMYNVDKGNTMTTLLHTDATTPSGVLITGLYLKSPVIPVETDCEYRSYGNLTDNGIVYCTQHGATPEYRSALITVTGLKPHSAYQEDEPGFAVAVLAISLFLTAIVLLAFFLKKRKPAGGEQPE